MAGFFVTPPNRQIAFRVAYDDVVEKQSFHLRRVREVKLAQFAFAVA
jgi:hypothetical protein